jgi:MoxR-like ATPase
MSARDPATVYGALREEIGTVLVGKDDIVEGLTVAFLTRGHVLLEGGPEVAKTTIANLFARASGLEYTRIQMTPDVLPADVTGTTIYHEATGEFELQRGPIFSNIVVADEINRATPKTQSALLEAGGAQRHHRGETLPLPDPFIVVATQNPIEHEGTFPLPEAQRDRFTLKLTVGLPDRDEERAILDEFDTAPDLGPESVERVTTGEELRELRATIRQIHVARPVKEYILDVVAATRESPDVRHGASPWASLAFLNAGKARGDPRPRLRDLGRREGARPPRTRPPARVEHGRRTERRHRPRGGRRHPPIGRAAEQRERPRRGERRRRRRGRSSLG